MTSFSSRFAEMEQWAWPPRPNDAWVPSADQPYWYPNRETMDPDLRNEAILERLRQVMTYAYQHSPFYQKKWRQVGLEPGDVRSLRDFQDVPLVTKTELREAQEASPPFGDYLCIELADVASVHGTSGTTGRPTAFGIGRDDWRSIAEAHARVMWGMGIRPSDTIFIAAVFSLYMGSWGVLAGAQRLGATVFPFGAGVAGQTARAVNWMRQMRPTVLYSTPSYALRVGEVAAEVGVDPREFGLRTMFFSGEPGASIPAIRKKIEDTFDANVFDCGSMAEMTPFMSLGETTARSGMLCWQDIVYTEVVDPATGHVVPFGHEGSPVYTHLERTSQPMIRLLSGDLTRWEAGPSPCGRTYPVLPRGIYGRIDDMLIVRGENIYPSAVEDVVATLADYGGEHRIIVNRQGSMDTLAVQVEYAKILNGNDQAIESFRDEAQKALQTVLGVRTKVVVLSAGTLERAEHKARRVIDQRDLLHSILAET